MGFFLVSKTFAYVLNEKHSFSLYMNTADRFLSNNNGRFQSNLYTGWSGENLLPEIILKMKHAKRSSNEKS